MKTKDQIQKKLEWAKDVIDEQGMMLGIDLPKFYGIVETLKWVLED